MVSVLCIMLNIFEPSLVKVSRRVSEIQTQTVGSMLGWSQFAKGYHSELTVDGVMVLSFCTSVGDALYLYQVSRKYLKGFPSY